MRLEQVKGSSAAARIVYGVERCGQDGLWGRALRLGWSMGPSPGAKQAGYRALRLGLTRKVAAWEIAQLGSCYLGKYPWEVTD